MVVSVVGGGQVAAVVGGGQVDVLVVVVDKVAGAGNQFTTAAEQVNLCKQCLLYPCGDLFCFCVNLSPPLEVSQLMPVDNPQLAKEHDHLHIVHNPHCTLA